MFLFCFENESECIGTNLWYGLTWKRWNLIKNIGDFLNRYVTYKLYKSTFSCYGCDGNNLTFNGREDINIYHIVFPAKQSRVKSRVFRVQPELPDFLRTRLFQVSMVNPKLPYFFGWSFKPLPEPTRIFRLAHYPT